MKRSLIAATLALAILAQAPRAYQAGPMVQGRSTYIVVLREPSVAERIVRDHPGGTARQSRRALSGAKPGRHVRAVETSQRRFLDSLGENRTPDVEVLHQETLLLNSLVVRAGSEEVLELRSHPGVRGVYPNRERRLLMDAAPQLVAAPEAWQEVGGAEVAGLGVRIGLIDSGINQDHIMFEDPDLAAPEGFPISKPQGFVNNKVIVARTFVKTEFGLNTQFDQTPRDEIGHGSRVAGVAAGGAVESPLASLIGIAPRAFLGNYKVFGTPGRNSTTTTAAVIAAINSAVEDGMDVINLSLGGPAIHPDNDPEQMTIANATALGHVFVIAGGNAGPGQGSIASPGTSPAAITAGASSNARTFGSALELTSNSPEFPSELGTILAVPGTSTSRLGRCPSPRLPVWTPREKPVSRCPREVSPESWRWSNAVIVPLVSKFKTYSRQGMRPG